MQQERRRTYSVQLRRVRVIISAMKKQQCLPPFFVVDAEVAVNNINVFSGAMDMEQWLPFALLSNYKLFRTAFSLFMDLCIVV